MGLGRFRGVYTCFSIRRSIFLHGEVRRALLLNKVMGAEAFMFPIATEMPANISDIPF
jgi:hypothetical protein